MRRQGMNLKFLWVIATAILGVIFTTISFSTSFLYSNTQPIPTLEVELATAPIQSKESAAYVDKFDDNEETSTSKTSQVKILRKKDEEEIPPNVESKNGFDVGGEDGLEKDGTIAISHVFSPYVMNDEFRIVSESWRISAERARQRGIEIDHICAVLPEDVKACPSFARQVTLVLRIENYRNKANALPSYGEMFSVLRDKGRGKYVMYSNADIAVVPEFYTKAWQMMHENLRTETYQVEQLDKARRIYYTRCMKFNAPKGSPESRSFIRAETLCARDAVVFFENNGGRPANNIHALLHFFKNATYTAKEAFAEAYDPAIPDPRTDGHSMTITRRQFAKADPAVVVKELFTKDFRDIKEDVLNRLFAEGEAHPGNDIFLVPRKHIPRLLAETPFIHLRPSGFLIGQHLKDQPNLVWRRLVSAPEQMLTFHVGKGTDEWPVRAEVQPRAVLFEVAHYFTRTNSTVESFWPPTWCQDAGNYREYGTSEFCGHLPGEFCRGNVRLACTKYWHHGSRDRHALNTICYRVSRKQWLERPFCDFCNVSL